MVPTAPFIKDMLIGTKYIKDEFRALFINPCIKHNHTELESDTNDNDMYIYNTDISTDDLQKFVDALGFKQDPTPMVRDLPFLKDLRIWQSIANLHKLYVLILIHIIADKMWQEMVPILNHYWSPQLVAHAKILAQVVQPETQFDKQHQVRINKPLCTRLNNLFSQYRQIDLANELTSACIDVTLDIEEESPKVQSKEYGEILQTDKLKLEQRYRNFWDECQKFVARGKKDICHLTGYFRSHTSLYTLGAFATRVCLFPLLFPFHDTKVKIIDGWQHTYTSAKLIPITPIHQHKRQYQKINQVVTDQLTKYFNQISAIETLSDIPAYAVALTFLPHLTFSDLELLGKIMYEPEIDPYSVFWGLSRHAVIILNYVFEKQQLHPYDLRIALIVFASYLKQYESSYYDEIVKPYLHRDQIQPVINIALGDYFSHYFLYPESVMALKNKHVPSVEVLWQYVFSIETYRTIAQTIIPAKQMLFKLQPICEKIKNDQSLDDIHLQSKGTFIKRDLLLCEPMEKELLRHYCSTALEELPVPIAKYFLSDNIDIKSRLNVFRNLLPIRFLPDNTVRSLERFFEFSIVKRDNISFYDSIRQVFNMVNMSTRPRDIYDIHKRCEMYGLRAYTTGLGNETECKDKLVEAYEKNPELVIACLQKLECHYPPENLLDVKTYFKSIMQIYIDDKMDYTTPGMFIGTVPASTDRLRLSIHNLLPSHILTTPDLCISRYGYESIVRAQIQRLKTTQDVEQIDLNPETYWTAHKDLVEKPLDVYNNLFRHFSWKTLMNKCPLVCKSSNELIWDKILNEKFVANTIDKRTLCNRLLWMYCEVVLRREDHLHSLAAQALSSNTFKVFNHTLPSLMFDNNWKNPEKFLQETLWKDVDSKVKNRIMRNCLVHEIIGILDHVRQINIENFGDLRHLNEALQSIFNILRNEFKLVITDDSYYSIREVLEKAREIKYDKLDIARLYDITMVKNIIALVDPPKQQQVKLDTLTNPSWSVYELLSLRDRHFRCGWHHIQKETINYDALYELCLTLRPNHPFIEIVKIHVNSGFDLIGTTKIETVIDTELRKLYQSQSTDPRVRFEILIYLACFDVELSEVLQKEHDMLQWFTQGDVTIDQAYIYNPMVTIQTMPFYIESMSKDDWHDFNLSEYLHYKEIENNSLTRSNDKSLWTKFQEKNRLPQVKISNVTELGIDYSSIVLGLCENINISSANSNWILALKNSDASIHHFLPQNRNKYQKSYVQQYEEKDKNQVHILCYLCLLEMVRILVVKKEEEIYNISEQILELAENVPLPDVKLVRVITQQYQDKPNDYLKSLLQAFIAHVGIRVEEIQKYYFFKPKSWSLFGS
jgi:hypothetical protein